jgi:hypothetical protein
MPRGWFAQPSGARGGRVGPGGNGTSRGGDKGSGQTPAEHRTAQTLRTAAREHRTKGEDAGLKVDVAAGHGANLKTPADVGLRHAEAAADDGTVRGFSARGTPDWRRAVDFKMRHCHGLPTGGSPRQRDVS